MQSDAGATHSLWMDTAEPPDFPPLRETAVRTNVCIVGAGIAGMSAAYMLTRAGKAVVVLDDGRIGSGETGRTTAHVTAALDDGFAEITRLHGEHGAKDAAESHMSAIQRIEAIVRLEDIDCDFERVDGYTFLAPGDDIKTLEEELEAARQAGFADAAIFQRAPLETFDTGAALRFPRQAQFHPLKYISGLARAVVRDGGKIYCGTKVTSVEDGQPCTVKTAGGQVILADDVIVATNSPVNDWMVMHTKQAPYRTYVVGLEVETGSIPHMLLWDTDDPYHYIRVHPAGGDTAHQETLIVGGEDHKTGQAHDTEERFSRLERYAREHFPNAGRVKFRWSGQYMQPVDAMAFIGKNPGSDEHIYIVTGDSGNGMTHGTIGGMLLTDLIMQRDNPWTKLYDPSRISFKAAPEFAKENLNVAEQYAQYLTPGDVGSIDAIEPGSGAVIRRGIHKIAVYKDESGTVTQCSAVCTHLYCIVDWNDTEKSWDCPCHGSRFDPYGRVVSGPAVSDLQKVER